MPFWDLVDIGSPDDCWPWRRRLSEDGYGGVSRVVDGIRYQRAHRLAYRLHHGAHPGELWVLHRCDNPPCCNPAHLWLGTAADNNADMIAKGRDRTPRGEEHWMRKHPERIPRGEGYWACHSRDEVPRGPDHYSKRLGGCPNHRNEKHSLTKVTDDQVREIRARYAAGGVFQRQLADEYGVSKGHINAIILRRFRQHVS